MAWKCRVACSGRSGRPSAHVKTNPASFHEGPKATRSMPCAPWCRPARRCHTCSALGLGSTSDRTATALGDLLYHEQTLTNGGRVAAISRGLYRKAGAEPADTDLIAIAVKAPRATLCLETALARHGLSDAIPVAPDVALPRGTRIPAPDALARWHQFTPATFDIGRELLALDGATSIGLYDAPRSIIDAFRMRATEGHELGYEALRRWLRASGSQPGQLIRLASQFPKAETPLRLALAVLL